MASNALVEWRTVRSVRIDRLMQAHVLVGGVGSGRRWATDEINHALVLRLTSEFQGFCRALHDEAIVAIMDAVAMGDASLRDALRKVYTAARRLDRGNAEPGGLGSDFSLFNMRLWEALQIRYPARTRDWSRELELLNEARNALAHDDQAKLIKVRSAGWPATLESVRRWRGALDGLAAAMDEVTRDHLADMLKTTPW
jgi:hypothetical protein